MADSNSTGVGGNVTPGHDFTGRDKHNVGDGSSYGNRVEVHTDRDRHPSGDTNAEILEALRRAVIGDPYNPAQPGILRSLADLTASMNALHDWRRTADVERTDLSRDMYAHKTRTEQRMETTDMRLATMMMIMWLTVAIVGVEAVAIIYLFVQRSVLVLAG